MCHHKNFCTQQFLGNEDAAQKGHTQTDYVGKHRDSTAYTCLDAEREAAGKIGNGQAHQTEHQRIDDAEQRADAIYSFCIQKSPDSDKKEPDTKRKGDAGADQLAFIGKGTDGGTVNTVAEIFPAKNSQNDTNAQNDNIEQNIGQITQIIIQTGVCSLCVYIFC